MKKRFYSILLTIALALSYLLGLVGCNSNGNPPGDTPPPPASSVRDLKVHTYQTEYFGVFSVIELPDGKLMLLDSGVKKFQGIVRLEELLLDEAGNPKQIDYFILTNSLAIYSGGISHLIGSYENLVVKDAYLPQYLQAEKLPEEKEAYDEAKDALTNKQGCTLHTIGDDDITITNQFSYNGANYSYSVNVLSPVAYNDASDYYGDDYQKYVTIEYMGKVILYTGIASHNNIDGYITKYDKDVDVLITGFDGSAFDAIANSASRNDKSFLQDTKLEEGDYAIITYIDNYYIDMLHTLLYNAGVAGYSFANLTKPRVVTAINIQGELTVAPKDTFEN